MEHYAGPVTYSCSKFLDKNKDTLSTGGRLYHISCAFLPYIFGCTLCQQTPREIASDSRSGASSQSWRKIRRICCIQPAISVHDISSRLPVTRRTMTCHRGMRALWHQHAHIMPPARQTAKQQGRDLMPANDPTPALTWVWAVWYITRLLVELTKGVAFSFLFFSFLFFSFLFFSCTHMAHMAVVQTCWR